ncbi:MAG: two-component system, NarL family, sensor kinase [Bacteroidales bacterium]|jgi:signal transduction histidine kinase|nr:two-component system, NarL family, sensor kinase [Bacteroidales bacterium]MDN5329777.1 two-component system, NarL family, sensor kinase [Bacteroidales bacterium]
MSRSRHFISLTEKLALSYLLVSLLITISMAILLYFALLEIGRNTLIQRIKIQQKFLNILVEQSIRNTLDQFKPDSASQGKNHPISVLDASNIKEFDNQSFNFVIDTTEHVWKFIARDASENRIIEINLPEKIELIPQKFNVQIKQTNKNETSKNKLDEIGQQRIAIESVIPLNDKELIINTLYSISNDEKYLATVLKFVLIGILISGVIFIYAYFTGRRIAQPLRELTEAAGKTHSGHFLVVKPPQVNDEVGQLAEAFNQMASRLRKQNEELEKERIRRLKSIIDSQELERKRVAKELHEGLAQDLVGLKFMINGLSRIENLESLKEQLPQMEKHADNMVEQIRVLSNKLSPTVLSGYGLGPALRFLAEESQRISGISIHMDTSGLPSRISGKMKTYLYRIVQEALQNSMTQRSIHHIEVTFATDITRLYIFVQDDGQGFPDFRLQNPGYGVYSMQERIELLGGNLRIESEAGHGNKVSISIPMRLNTES